MADFDRFQNFGVREMDAARIAGLGIVVQREILADLQHLEAIGEFSDAQLRALQVRQNADRAADRSLHIADPADERTHQVMIGMTHIDAEDVGARLVEFGDLLLGGRCRAEGREDLHASIASHCCSVATPGVSVSCTIQLACSPVSYSRKPMR